MKKQLNEFLVSVIVPIYNGEKHLLECIDSIINQTHNNIEIILVNDGSSDNSGKIADEYAQKDDRIKVIHQQNSGVSTTRNSGIDASTGDYICFSDADDYLEIDYVEYLLNIAVQADADISLTTEMYMTYVAKNQTKEDKIEIYSPEEATAEILYCKVPIGVYCKMFRRDFLNANKIRFIPEIYIGEGFNFNTAAFQRANKVVFGHKKVYFYRKDNSDSAMTKFSIDKCNMALYAIDNIKKDFVIKTKRLNTAWEYARWRTTYDMWHWMIVASSDKKYPEIHKKYLHTIKTKAYLSLFIPIKFREKLRAILLVIYPKLVVYRRKKLSS
ncbi:MAG: glycosyltransferase [Dysgonamonadaceae bacterium]|jgi:glycosyltransferase involved in cell wall biosynthesis|nr:glycosyltransferase [Dysgonamonadaceae bacterium]